MPSVPCVTNHGDVDAGERIGGAVARPVVDHDDRVGVRTGAARDVRDGGGFVEGGDDGHDARLARRRHPSPPETAITWPVM